MTIFRIPERLPPPHYKDRKSQFAASGGLPARFNYWLGASVRKDSEGLAILGSKA